MSTVEDVVVSVAQLRQPLKTYEVAVEAYAVLEGDYPTDENDLLEAELIRTESDLYGVRFEHITTEPEVDAATAACMVLVDGIAGIEELPPDVDAPTMLAALADLQQELETAGADAPASQHSATATSTSTPTPVIANFSGDGDELKARDHPPR